jgi:hypothetical protein
MTLSKAKDCTNLHEYYNQVEAYFSHANFSDGSSYSARKQVEIFLNGLDSAYDPVARILKQHMMTWHLNDPDPPHDLRLILLPRTIERLTEETPTKATVHYAVGGKQTHNGKGGPKSPAVPSIKPIVDIQCSYAKTMGIKESNVRKWPNLLFYYNRWKKKLTQCQQLLDHHNKSMETRCVKKKTKVKGMIRQLWAEGHVEQGDALFDMSQYAPDDVSEHAESDDKSTQS